MIHKTLFTVVAVGLVLGLAAPATTIERVVWRHSQGFFENDKGNDWYEKSPNGKFEFKEVKRTEEYIELTNIGSGNRVRLLNDRCVQVNMDGDEIKLYYIGKWE